MDEIGTVVRDKAILIVKGYSQKEGTYFDETFVLVARLKAIRMFLTFVTHSKFIMYQMNVNFEFLEW